MTTADGYTIVKGTDGYYRYATLIDGQLMATPAKASDVSGRNKAENLFLQTMRKGIAPEMSPQAKRLKEGMLHQTGLLQQLRPNKRNSSASLQKAGISHDYRGRFCWSTSATATSAEAMRMPIAITMPS